MNRLKSIFAVLAAMALILSCGKDEPVVEYLEVTPNNLAGEWKLVEWSGMAHEYTYFYIDFVRKDRKFTIYQNFDSMENMPHVVTGEFNIEEDLEKGAVIRGIYDYDEGFWTYKYEVNELTDTSMTWIAIGNPAFIQKFVRTSIPAEIKGE